MLFNFQGPSSLSEVFFRSATYLSYHISERLSSFFQNFFYFFFSLLRRSAPGKIVSAFCVVGTAQIPNHWLLLTFFCSFLWAVVRQLCYNTTPDSNCQHLFSIFFLFLQIVLSFFPFFPFLLYFTKELLLSVDFFTSY